ncbi:YigZ family protein [Bifidobacterium sp. UBA6881]|uniref:IMPACT family protein n=1 Tax=Bifidobacterium sp. UBA6881 TaxID=1946109 RepID=UPI000EE32767|nr:YigZ family protein [Bifidobacterium sp. UBA6881]HAH53404.1 IMPACT family protein [Bifidobacterium sp.]HCA74322.1 IMPACT family protein [Bifidobacterium sp.]HCH22657.1 IMPACT family protein [Bifidobacterium sp.]
MQTILDSADRPAHDAFVEKKSEFIGDACHVDSLDEALAFVQTIRDRHPKARHVAYAAVCGGSDGRLAERMSDDGEPSGTAGKPILDVLRANEMTDCVVAVTRYFGGILLGSGGLIRAYSTGASIAVKAASKARIVPCAEYRVTLDYPQLGSFQNLLAGVDGEQADAQYTDRIELTVVVPQERQATFESRIIEAFNATVKPALTGTSNRPVKL